MNTFSKIVLCCFILLFTTNIKAQDIHLSQFYTAPLLLNPGLTGHIEGKYRFNLNYKRQWTGVTKSGVFNTPALSFDINLKKKKESRHSFGLGLAMFNDLSGSNNKLSNLSVMLSGAGHFNIDKNEKHYISLGLNTGFSNKRFKTQDMIFASQYDGLNFDEDRASGENFENTSFFNVDTRVGLVYAAYPSAKTHIKLGGAYFHAVKMKESLYGLDENRPSRIVASGEMYHAMNPKFALQPYVLFMTQAKAMETLFGANIYFIFGFENAFFLGGAYRMNDAAIATAGVEIKKFRLGLSYDITTSDLGSITRGKSDFEISLQFIGLSKEDSKPILPALRYF